MPTIAETLQLARRHHLAGHIQEAEALYCQILQIQPDHAEAHSDLGAALQAQGRLEEAAAHCRRAIELQPGFTNAYYNLALVRQDQGQMEEAAANYRQALALAPSFVEAHCNLGAVLQAKGKLDEAVRHYQQALLIKPTCAEAHLNLSSACAEQGNVELSGCHYQEALRIKPDNILWRLSRDATAPVIINDVEAVMRWRSQCERALEGYAPIDLDECSADLALCNPRPSFYSAYQGCDERPIRTKFARLFRTKQAKTKRAGSGRRPRIGFVATASHEAAFLNLTRGIINTIAPDLRPTVVCASSAVAQMRSGLDVEVDVLGIPRSFPAAVEAVKDARFDLLYYWEIGTDSVNYFMPFFGLAPVQCTSWGYPVTTGIPGVDYFISSGSLEPSNAQAHYSETLVLLNALPVFYYRPALKSPVKDRADFGLPERGTLYSCLQSLFKFHPDFDEVIGGILRADRRGLLLLLEGSQRHWTELLRQRFQKTIPDVLDRVRILPRQSPEDFLQLQAIADVILDPFYWSGNNTTHDALAFGTPIVTLPSEFMRGRVTYGCYRQMGVLDCVASSREEYVALAVRLGTDRAYRETVKAKILAANAVLYENAGAVRELERFFLEAVAKHAGNS